MSKFFRLALASLLLVSSGARALAQSDASSGRIVGTVKDPNGAAVPNASVTVTNEAKGITRTLTTNDEGGFVATALPSGEYTVSVTAQGFGPFTQTGYRVEVGSALDANITLQV